MSRTFLGVSAFVLLGPMTATAQPAGARRIAVLVLRAGAVSAAAADTMTELLVGMLAERGGIEIVGKEELQAQLGQSEEQSLQCIDSPACIGRVGVQLNVQEVIGGTVAERSPGDWVYNINRIDVASNRVTGRLFREVRGSISQVVASLRGSVDDLFRPPFEPATVRISSTVDGARVFFDDSPAGEAPLTRENVAPGRHRVRVSRSGHQSFEDWVVVSSGANVEVVAVLGRADTTSPVARVAFWGGLALVALGAGGGAYFFIQATQTVPSQLNQRQREGFFDARDTDYLVAQIAFGAAGAGALLSIGFLVFGPELVFSGAGPAQVAVAPLLGPGLAGMQTAIRW